MMPEIHLPASIEALRDHQAKLLALAHAAMEDPDILGMTIKGSFALESADEFSDLDLSFVIREGAYEDALGRRLELAGAPEEPVASFTADHLGVPELLIVLYDDLVHVDFRYVPLNDFPDPQEDLPCRVVWERDGVLTERLSGALPAQSHLDLAWIEARMWTWVWYTHAKILRGEVYEALDALQFLRSTVLFPLVAVTRGERPRASRRAEELVGDLGEDFAATVASPSRSATMQALEKTVHLYLHLADPLLRRRGIPKAQRARNVVLRALQAALELKP